MLLAQAGKRVAVLEAAQVGEGTSGHSTGNLYAPVDVRLHRVEEQWGTDAMAAVAAARTEAVDLVERTCASLQIDCGFVRCGWHLLDSDQQARQEIDKEFAAAQCAGLPATCGDEAPLGGRTAHTLRIDRQAQFQPLDYLRQLAQRISGENCLVFENSPVIAVEDGPGRVATASGSVNCAQVILATHTPVGIHLVQSALEVVREYGIALRVGQPLPPGIFWELGAAGHHSVRGFSRSGQHYLVVVGAGHPTGEASDTAQRLGALEDYARDHFQCGPSVYRWSAQRYRAKDKLPFIGRNVDAANTFIATGFSSDGLTYGTMAGMLLADALLGRDNARAGLYRVDRIDTGKRPEGFEKESTQAPAQQPRPGTSRFDDLRPCEARQEEVDGQPLAAFRDEQGQLMIVSAKCTHMGCDLKWNEAETSWDCHCHGSRFAPNGKVLEGPALAPLPAVGKPAAGSGQPSRGGDANSGDEF
ncbi:MAG TPA: FAD-dependent oxidoreductase, partial [Telluria sp.]|nr:FAD-dependent oxidoreductase [Telluria sp.]